MQERPVALGAALQSSEALQERLVSPPAAHAAIGDVIVASSGVGSNSCSIRSHCRNVLWHVQQQLQRSEVLQDRFGLRHEQFSWSFRRRYKIVFWLWQQQLQRSEMLQERSGTGSSNCQAWERYMSVLLHDRDVTWGCDMARPRSVPRTNMCFVALWALVAGPGSVTGASCGMIVT